MAPVLCVVQRSDTINVRIKTALSVSSIFLKPVPYLRDGTTQERAMKHFHVRASDGRVLSGAAAFVEVWTHLPRWCWAARAASLPGALIALEWGYRIFLQVRQFISHFFGRALGLRTATRGAKRW